MQFIPTLCNTRTTVFGIALFGRRIWGVPTLGVLLVTLLVLLLIGGIPAVGLSSAGWYPYGSGIGLAVAIIIALLLLRGARQAC